MKIATRKAQQGFTLVEIAVVLVIIGLLLGGVLKGQELINSAKAKSLVQEFRAVSTMVYSYQDRFRFLPGDDPSVVNHVNGTKASTATQTQGDGRIEGAWNSATVTDESYLFWQHVRLANLASGATKTDATDYLPLNAENGPLGITSTAPKGLSGNFFICSGNLSGRFARQLDTTMDDGATDTGTVRTYEKDKTGEDAQALDSTHDGNSGYVVCAAY
jgi:prepilin-type N-terminal cleavage/methylation domain-containing protein